MPRNPDWTRDELILALDLYFRFDRKQLDAKNPEVIELSKTLNLLQIHGNDKRNAEFRNSQGVSMKLANFSSIDPEYSGVGLQRGGKLDKQIWDEFANDESRLRTVAASIRKSLTWISESKADYVTETINADDDDEFPEGKVLTRIHKHKERNPQVTLKKKRKVLQESGKLECEVCGFDFVEIYGQLGYGFAECHHIVPVSELVDGHKTKLSDLAIVCANCHRMLHKARPLLSITELREIIKKSSVKQNRT
jgi:5-methylcytosine-specific restriction protein A